MSDTQGKSSKAPTDIGAKGIAHVYAEALLNAADRNNIAEEVLGELEELVERIFPDHHALVETFINRSISREKKAHLIRSLFQDRASETFSNFLLVLNDHDRLELLEAIFAEAQEIWNERQQRIPVLVRSAVPLEENQRNQLEQQLRDSFGKEPLIEAVVDEDLLGGLMVQVGDWLFDGSAKSRLEQIRSHLIESSSHELEDRRDRFGSFGTD